MLPRLPWWFSCFFLLSVVGALPAQSPLFLGIHAGGGQNGVEVRGGVPLLWLLNRQQALLFELAFTRRGDAQLSRLLPETRPYLTSVASYAEATVLWTYGWHRSQLRVFGLVGPALGYGVAVDATYRNSSQQFEREHYAWRATRIARWDVGVYLGGGIGLHHPRGQLLQVDLRFYLGLKDLDRVSSSAFYHQGLMLGLGYFLPLQ